MKQIILSLFLIVSLISCNKEDKMCKCEPEGLYEGYNDDLALANKIIGKKWKLQGEEVYVDLSSEVDEEKSLQAKAIRGESVYENKDTQQIENGNYNIHNFKSAEEKPYNAQKEGKILGYANIHFLSNATYILEITQNTLILQNATEFLDGTNDGKEYWEVVK